MSMCRVVSMLLLAAYLPACTAYHQTSVPLAELTAAPKPVERVRVTRPDGSRLQVWAPHVTADSLVGWNAAPGKETGGVAVALADIRRWDVQKVDALKTLGVTAAVFVVIGLFIALAGRDACVGYCPQ